MSKVHFEVLKCTGTENPQNLGNYFEFFKSPVSPNTIYAVSTFDCYLTVLSCPFPTNTETAIGFKTLVRVPVDSASHYRCHVVPFTDSLGFTVYFVPPSYKSINYHVVSIDEKTGSADITPVATLFTERPKEFWILEKYAISLSSSSKSNPFQVTDLQTMKTTSTQLHCSNVFPLDTKGRVLVLSQKVGNNSAYLVNLNQSPLSFVLLPGIRFKSYSSDYFKSILIGPYLLLLVTPSDIYVVDVLSQVVNHVCDMNILQRSRKTIFIQDKLPNICALSFVDDYCIRIDIPVKSLPFKEMRLGHTILEVMEHAKFADIAVISKDGSTKCHKAILEARVPALLATQSKDTIDLSGYPNHVVRMFLEFVYCGFTPSLTIEVSIAELNQLKELAAKYKLEPLVLLAEKYMRKIDPSQKPESDVILATNLVKSLLAQNRLKEARDKAKNMMTLYPKYKSSHSMMGAVELADGNYWDALKLFLYAYHIGEKKIELEHAVKSVRAMLLNSKDTALDDEKRTLLQQVPLSSLAQSFLTLTKQSKHADLNLILDNVKYPAHKLFLALDSEFFSNLFEDDDIEQSAEFSLDTLNLGLTPKSLQQVLHYIYSRDTTPVKKLDCRELESTLKFANFFGYSDLKDACEQTLLSMVNNGNAFLMLDIAKRHDCSSIKELCMTLLFPSTSNSKENSFDLAKYKPLHQIEPIKSMAAIDKIALFGDAELLENNVIRVAQNRISNHGAVYWTDKFNLNSNFTMSLALDIPKKTSFNTSTLVLLSAPPQSYLGKEFILKISFSNSKTVEFRTMNETKYFILPFELDNTISIEITSGTWNSIRMWVICIGNGQQPHFIAMELVDNFLALLKNSLWIGFDVTNTLNTAQVNMTNWSLTTLDSTSKFDDLLYKNKYECYNPCCSIKIFTFEENNDMSCSSHPYGTTQTHVGYKADVIEDGYSYWPCCQAQDDKRCTKQHHVNGRLK